VLIAALRAAFGGCALHAPADAAAREAVLLKNPPGAHRRRSWSTLTQILFRQKMFRFSA